MSVSKAIDPRDWFRPETLDRTEAGATIRWRVDASLPYFDGHFPGMPILPAVAVVDATVCFAERMTDAHLQLMELPSAKFTRPIVPGQDVRVELTQRPDGTAILFQASWFSADERLAELTVRAVVESKAFTN